MVSITPPSVGAIETEKHTAKPSIITKIISFKRKSKSRSSEPQAELSDPSSSRPPQLRDLTPVDIRALEAFLGPIGTPRTNLSSHTQQQSSIRDLENQVPPSAWKRPSLSQVARNNLKRVTVIVILFMVLIGMIPGWIIFLNRMKRISQDRKSKGEDDTVGNDTLIMVGNGCFIVVLLITLATLTRTSLKLLTKFQPPKPPSLTPTSPSSSSEMSDIPPWLLPPLPTYSHATQRGTGDVEDQYITNEGLPKYGEVRGSKLLLRSESRSGTNGELGEDGEGDEEGGSRIEVFYRNDTDGMVEGDGSRISSTNGENRPNRIDTSTSDPIGSDTSQVVRGALDVQVDLEVDDDETLDQGENGGLEDQINIGGLPRPSPVEESRTKM